MARPKTSSYETMWARQRLPLRSPSTAMVRARDGVGRITSGSLSSALRPPPPPPPVNPVTRTYGMKSLTAWALVFQKVNAVFLHSERLCESWVFAFGYPIPGNKTNLDVHQWIERQKKYFIICDSADGKWVRFKLQELKTYNSKFFRTLNTLSSMVSLPSRDLLLERLQMLVPKGSTILPKTIEKLYKSAFIPIKHQDKDESRPFDINIGFLKDNFYVARNSPDTLRFVMEYKHANTEDESDPTTKLANPKREDKRETISHPLSPAHRRSVRAIQAVPNAEPNAELNAELKPLVSRRSALSGPDMLPFVTTAPPTRRSDDYTFTEHRTPLTHPQQILPQKAQDPQLFDMRKHDHDNPPLVYPEYPVSLLQSYLDYSLLSTPDEDLFLPKHMWHRFPCYADYVLYVRKRRLQLQPRGRQ